MCQWPAFAGQASATGGPLSRDCFVTVSITRVDEGFTAARELGEFHGVWRKGVSIGSDEACAICLPGLAPVAAVVLAVSNHKVLYLPGSANFELARNHAGGRVPDYDARIDHSGFHLCAYHLQFGTRYRDAN